MDKFDHSARQGSLPSSPIDQQQQHDNGRATFFGADPTAGQSIASLEAAHLSSRATDQGRASDARSMTSDRLMSIRSDVIANWLYTKSREKQWTTGTSVDEGVFIKKENRGEYAQYPPENTADPSSLRKAVIAMNVRVRLVPEQDLSLC